MEVKTVTLEMNEHDAKTLQFLLESALVSGVRQPSEAEFNFIQTTHASLWKALSDIEENRSGEQVQLVNHFTAGLK